MGIEHLQNQATPDDTRRVTDTEAWKRAFRENLFYVLGRFPATTTANDKYLALAYSVRDRLLDRWVKTSETYYRKKSAHSLLSLRRVPAGAATTHDQNIALDAVADGSNTGEGLNIRSIIRSYRVCGSHRLSPAPKGLCA